MKVIVDQDKCISSGQCVLNASEIFDQRDEDGVVVLLNENPPAEHADRARRAAGACPFAPPPEVLAMGAVKPLSRVRIWDGSTPWLITGYVEARALFSDSRV